MPPRSILYFMIDGAIVRGDNLLYSVYRYFQIRPVKKQIAEININLQFFTYLQHVRIYSDIYVHRADGFYVGMYFYKIEMNDLRVVSQFELYS